MGLLAIPLAILSFVAGSAIHDPSAPAFVVPLFGSMAAFMAGGMMVYTLSND